MNTKEKKRKAAGFIQYWEGEGKGVGFRGGKCVGTISSKLGYLSGAACGPIHRGIGAIDVFNYLSMKFLSVIRTRAGKRC